MRLFALLSLLLPALVQAQPFPGGACSLSATCAAKRFSLNAGNLLCLNRTACTTTVSASATTAGMVLNSGVANSGTNAAYTFGTTNALSGSTNLAAFINGGTTKLRIDDDGQILGTFATPQLINMAYGANGIQLATGSSGGGDVVVTDSGGNVFMKVGSATIAQGAANNPVPVLHAAQSTAAQAMEHGKTAATAGALAVTFATAFASAPTCTCVITAAVPVACGITTAANTTSVTFTAGAGTDVINWICIGAK